MRLLTGKLPFVGDDGGSATEKIQHVAPVPPSHLRPGLPAAINGVVAKALQKNREHRYADAATFAYALREANEETVGRPAAKSLPKRSKKVVLAAVLALLGLAAGFAFVSPREAKPTVAAVCPPTQVLNDGQCGCPPGRSLENLVCVQPAPAPAQAPAPVACSLPNVMVGGQCVPCSSLKDNPLMYQGLGCDKVQ